MSLVEDLWTEIQAAARRVYRPNLATVIVVIDGADATGQRILRELSDSPPSSGGFVVEMTLKRFQILVAPWVSSATAAKSRQPYGDAPVVVEISNGTSSTTHITLENFREEATVN